MLAKKTAFVVGAGASAEFKFPIGGALAKIIAGKSDVSYKSNNSSTAGDEQLFQSVKQSNPSLANQIGPAFWRIRDGILLSNSIDDFLDRHQEDEAMRIAGKSAIAKSILEQERRSPLFTQGFNEDFKVLNVENTWVIKLVRMLGTGISANRIFENVAFISFNYDRSLERVLWQAVRGLYALKREAMPEIMAPLRIVHPYGQIAPLPETGSTDAVPYGGNEYGDNPAMLAKNIFTYTEQVRDKKDAMMISEIMSWSKQIVFLGFGFHAPNMDLLKVEDGINTRPTFGTMFEVSKPNAQFLENRVASLFHDQAQYNIKSFFKFEDMTASGLLDHYRLPLME